MRNLDRLLHPENNPFKDQMCSGPLLIIGGGRCVWDDLARFNDKAFGGTRMAINDIGQHYMGHIDHWATLHPEYMHGWLHYRQTHVMSGDRPPLVHSDKAHHAVDYAWSLQTSGGTSGLLAVWVGILMGFDPITIAGVPMDGSGHYFDPPDYSKTDFHQAHIRASWDWAATEIFDGRVKSMSGWTAKLLGTPGGHTW